MMPPARYLVDASALAVYADPAVAARVDPLILNGLAVSCPITDLQLLGCMRDSQAYLRLAAIRRASCDLLHVRDEDLRLALDTQHRLAEQGQLGIAWPCLLVAVVAAR
jgi:predicted nucleic acid-binding protein